MYLINIHYVRNDVNPNNKTLTDNLCLFVTYQSICRHTPGAHVWTNLASGNRALSTYTDALKAKGAMYCFIIFLSSIYKLVYTYAHIKSPTLVQHLKLHNCIK